MPKNKTAPRKRDESLPPEYLTVEYFPPEHGTRLPVRGGTREPQAFEAEADRKLETPKKGGR